LITAFNGGYGLKVECAEEMDGTARFQKVLGLMKDGEGMANVGGDASDAPCVRA
jgi:hypothetical protein